MLPAKHLETVRIQLLFIFLVVVAMMEIGESGGSEGSTCGDKGVAAMAVEVRRL